jgi:hypothetical protein
MRCSNPSCRALTSGPQVDPSKSLNIGVAAHISAACEGGPRYDASLSADARRTIRNGIWLCQGCAKLVDNDPAKFSLALLAEWKATAEDEAFRDVGRSTGDARLSALSFSFDERLGLEINPRFGFSFLYPKEWDRRDPDNNDGNVYVHPTDERIEMRAWGGYAVVSPSLEDWVQWTLGHEAQRPGYRLLMDRASGRHVHYFTESKEGVVECRMQIDGRRVVYDGGEGGGSTTTMQVFTQFESSQFAIRCKAPVSEFSRYEHLFLTVGQSLRVLGEHPDRFRKNSRGQGGS